MAQIQSGADGTILTVDPVSKSLRASLYDTEGDPIAGKNGAPLPATGQQGFAVGGINDGSFRVQRLDRYGNQRIGFDTMLFRDSSEATAVAGAANTPNLGQWITAVSGFAVGAPTVSGNQLTATSVLTAGAYAIATSLRQFQKTQKGPLFYRRRGRTVTYTGTVNEFGFGAPATNVITITDSAHWRYTSTGMVIPVVTVNGTEITGIDISSELNNVNYYTYEIIVDDDNVLFVCQDISTGESISEQAIQIPSGAARLWTKTHMPIFERVYNVTAPAQAPLCLFSDILVESFDLVTNKDWRHQIVTATAGGAEIYPGSFIAASAQTANWVNSTVPNSATLSNTVGGYTTLGGKFQFAAVAGAETDYALFAYTVPIGFTFVCTGIKIDTFINGAASGATATVLEWAIANNSLSATLVTTNITRTPIGVQVIAANSPIGTCANSIDMVFNVPKKTDSSRVMHVILRMPIGLATASQLIRGNVTLHGYFE